MTTITSPLAPSLWNRTRITFVSTCPRCGQERFQHGYTRRILSSLLSRRSTIDAYCIECNVCWPINESERRAISPQLNAKSQKCNGAASTWCSQRRARRESHWQGDVTLAGGQFSLQQALRILCGIRLRYEIDRGNSPAPFRSLLVALSCADMLWITAAIEALEKAIAAGAIEAADRTSRVRTET